jgi:hypothetical protein
MDPFELEQTADRALKALPPPRAPHTLLPRVMAAVAQLGPAPRTWFTWPRAWQLASVGALVMLTIGAAWLATTAEAAVGARAAAFMTRSSSITFLIGGALTAGETARAAWQTIQPIVCGVLLFLLVMSTACVVFGVALGRVAHMSVGEAFQR